ncbi:hypothetical protein [Oricola sp.]|nr:hypothetical protein [Oricola sp.]MCI5077080.1 hypothetical protein [Oricola sp.]
MAALMRRLLAFFGIALAPAVRSRRSQEIGNDNQDKLVLDALLNGRSCCG